VPTEKVQRAVEETQRQRPTPRQRGTAWRLKWVPRRSDGNRRAGLVRCAGGD
jgi:hypothetical protein